MEWQQSPAVPPPMQRQPTPSPHATGFVGGFEEGPNQRPRSADDTVRGMTADGGGRDGLIQRPIASRVRRDVLGATNGAAARRRAGCFLPSNAAMRDQHRAQRGGPAQHCSGRNERSASIMYHSTPLDIPS